MVIPKFEQDRQNNCKGQNQFLKAFYVNKKNKNMFNHFVDRLNQTNMINNRLHNTQLIKYDFAPVEVQQNHSSEKK